MEENDLEIANDALWSLNYFLNRKESIYFNDMKKWTIDGGCLTKLMNLLKFIFFF